MHTGQTVLIHAGAGGVGHVAVQIARAFGAQVFATVSAEKQRIVEDFGATAIDYRRSSVEEYVAANTDGLGFDIVYDTVGGAILDAYSGVFTLLPLIGKHRAHHGPILAEAAALADAGKLRPLLSKERFSTDRLEEAYALAELVH